VSRREIPGERRVREVKDEAALNDHRGFLSIPDPQKLSTPAMKLQKPIPPGLSGISRASGSPEILCQIHSDGGNSGRSQISDLAI
jgi:hypothetical protein